MIATTDLRAVAHLVCRIRPDWDHPGVWAQLDRASRDGLTLADVAAAAIDAARTPTTTTPAGIGSRLRSGWSADAPVDRPTPTPPVFVPEPVRPSPPTASYLAAKAALKGSGSC
jgi:hypothetical protein